jgi:hypothetical protein
VRRYRSRPIRTFGTTPGNKSSQQLPKLRTPGNPCSHYRLRNGSVFAGVGTTARVGWSSRCSPWTGSNTARISPTSSGYCCRRWSYILTTMRVTSRTGRMAGSISFLLRLWRPGSARRCHQLEAAVSQTRCRKSLGCRHCCRGCWR